jgi:transcription antitermination factor NusG
MLMVIKTGLEDAFGELERSPAFPPEQASEMCMILVRSPLEQEARDSLRRRGIGAWWPNYQKEVASRDKQTGKRFNRMIRSGVLPGVILTPAKFNSQFWDAIDLAPGVLNVLQKTNGHYLVLTDVDIVLIHKIEHGLNRAPPTKLVHHFKGGDKVRFSDDLTRSLPPGIVVKCARDGHITVEVNMRGQMRPIIVLPHQIELV